LLKEKEGKEMAALKSFRLGQREVSGVTPREGEEGSNAVERGRSRALAKFAGVLRTLAKVCILAVATISYASEPPPVLERSLCCFSGVPGLAVDAQGNIYVANVLSNQIVKLGPDGSVIASWATSPVPGSDNRLPIEVQVDGNGDVWVGTLGSIGSVGRYTSDGTFLGFVATFNNAREFALGPGGIVYVVNHNFGEIRKYREDGTLITSWGAGPFPLGIAVDSSGRVYVALNRGGGPIQIFSPDGALLGQLNGLGGLRLRIDPNDRIYATLGSSVKKFTTSGEVLWEIAGLALIGLALDAQGRIYVGEDSESTSRDRVHIFVPAPLRISIDIKPGSFPNSINPKSRGKIPVAILSSATFNALAQVDQGSLKFGRTGDEPSLAFCSSSGEDVNGDNLLDLVCHFHTLTAAFQSGDTQGTLKGKTTSGTPITGTDSVRIVPPK
jgi:sugar lactone lactonase YvrE